MPTRIDVPNFGSIDFPDEMSLDDITSALRKQFPPQSEAESKWVIQDTLSRLGKGVAEQGAQALQGVVRGTEIAKAQQVPANLQAFAMQAAMEGADVAPAAPLIEKAQREAPVIAQRAAPENPFFQLGRDVEEAAGQFYQPNPAYDDTIRAKLIQGASSTVPVLASGPLAPITYAGMMGETSAREAEEKGASPEKVADTFLANAALGMTSEFLLGVPYLLRSAKAIKGVAAEVSKTALGKRLAALTAKHPVASLAARGAVAEGIQEGPIEQVGQNAIAKFVGQYDTERPIFQDVAEQAAYGAAIGLLLGGLFGGAASIDKARAAKRSTTEAPDQFQDPATGEWLSADEYAARQPRAPETKIVTPFIPAVTPTQSARQRSQFDLERLDWTPEREREEQNAIALRIEQENSERERTRVAAQLQKEREDRIVAATQLPTRPTPSRSDQLPPSGEVTPPSITEVVHQEWKVGARYRWTPTDDKAGSTVEGYLYKEPTGNVIGLIGDNKNHHVWLNRGRVEEIEAPSQAGHASIERAVQRGWEVIASGEFAKSIENLRQAFEDFLRGQKWHGKDPGQTYSDYASAGKTGKDSSPLVKEAIKLAKKHGPSPEFRSLFGGIDPILEGTTNEKVKAFAASLDIEYIPLETASPSAIISRGRFRPAPTQQTVRPAFVKPPTVGPLELFGGGKSIGTELRNKLPEQVRAAFDSLPPEIQRAHGIARVNSVTGLVESEDTGFRYDQRRDALLLDKSMPGDAEAMQNEVIASWAFNHYKQERPLYEAWRTAAFPEGQPAKEGFSGFDQADSFARSVMRWLAGNASPEVRSVLDARFGKATPPTVAQPATVETPSLKAVDAKPEIRNLRIELTKLQNKLDREVEKMGDLEASMTPEERAELAALEADLASKLRQYNMAVDPTIVITGGRIAFLYAKAGVRQFRDFANRMLAKFGEAGRQYLMTWYNNARMQAGGEGWDNEAEAQRIYDAEFSGRSESRRAVPETVGGPSAKRSPIARVVRRELIPQPRSYVRTDSYAAKSGFTLGEEQTDGINQAVTHFLDRDGRAFVIADGTGFGKTAQLLGIIDQFKKARHGAKILFVTQNQQMIKGSITGDSRAMGIDLGGITLTTYSKLHSLTERDFDLVIFDEAHNLKNGEARKSMAAARVRAAHKLFSTATPMDKPSGAAYFLAEITGKDEVEVANELGYTFQQRIDPYTQEPHTYAVLKPGFSWAKVWANIIAYRDAAIRGGAMLRREYPFYGQVNVQAMPMDRRSKMEQETIERHYDRLIDGASMPSARRNYSGQKTLTLRRWAEQPKIEEAFRQALDHVNSGGQVIIMAETDKPQSFPVTIKGATIGQNEKGRTIWRAPGAIEQLTVLFEKAGIQVAHIHDTTRYNVADEVDKFQTGRAPVALATPQSGGAGINLDDVAGDKPRLLVILSKNLAGDLWDQVLGRVSRKTTQSEARVEVLSMPDAYGDQRADDILDKKIRTLRAIQGGEDLDTAAGFEAEQHAAPQQGTSTGIERGTNEGAKTNAANSAGVAVRLEQSGEVLWGTASEINEVLARTRQPSVGQPGASRRSELAETRGVRAREEATSAAPVQKARIFIPTDTTTPAARKNSDILAHRIIYGTWGPSETEVQLLGHAAFGFALRAKLNKPRVVFRRFTESNAPAMRYDRIPGIGDFISVNIDQIGNFDFSDQGQRLEMDGVLSEELIHAATLRLSSDEELGQVWRSLSTKEQSDVRGIYPRITNDFEGGAEYVRLVLQERFAGTVTEQHRWRITDAVRNILRKLVNFLKEAFEAKSADNIAQQVIERIEGAINGDAPIAVSIFDESQSVSTAISRPPGVRTQMQGSVFEVKSATASPVDRAAGLAGALDKFQQAGLPAIVGADGNAWLSDGDGWPPRQLEGVKLLQLANEAAAEMDELAQIGAPPNDRNVRFLDSVRHLSERMQAMIDRGEEAAFDQPLVHDLMAIGQGVPSEIGRLLKLFDSGQRDFVTRLRNVDVELRKTLNERFNGQIVRKVLMRAAEHFRDFFTDAEIKILTDKNTEIAKLFEMLENRTANERGSYVYRVAQARMKPQIAKTIKWLEEDAKRKEAVAQILQNFEQMGGKLPEKKNAKLTPREQLILLAQPETAEMLDAAIAKAVREAERNAARPLVETELKSQGLSNEEVDVAMGLYDDSTSNPEVIAHDPSPEQIDQGFQSPTFTHWKVVRDSLLGYSPVTDALIRKVIAGDFTGTKFDKPGALKPVEAKIDLNALAKSPDVEAQRILDANAANLESELTAATPFMRARIKMLILEGTKAQLAMARQRFLDSFFEPRQFTRLAPSDKLKQLLNAGAENDARFRDPLVKRLVAKLASTPAADFDEQATRTRDEKNGWIQDRLIEISQREGWENLNDDTRAFFEAVTFTKLAEGLQAAEERITRRFIGGQDVSFAPKTPATLAEQEARRNEAKSKLKGIIRAGGIDTVIVEQAARKSAVQKFTPNLTKMVQEILDTPTWRHNELAEKFADRLLDELSLDPALRDKARAIFQSAFRQKLGAAAVKAVEAARTSLTPREQNELPTKKLLWKRLVEMANAKGFDTLDTLMDVAEKNRWEISESDLARMRALAAQEQKLSKELPDETLRQIGLTRDQLTEYDRTGKGLTPEEAAKLSDARLAQSAITTVDQNEIHHKMVAQWAKMTKPINVTSVEGGRNLTRAINDLSVINILTRWTFGTVQGIDVATQSFFHNLFTAVAHANLRNAALPDSERGFVSWMKEQWKALGINYDTTKATWTAGYAALWQGLRSGKGLPQRIESVETGVHTFSRMAAKADELLGSANAVDNVKGLLLWLQTEFLFGRRITGALDQGQSEGARFKEFAQMIRTYLRVERGYAAAQAEAWAKEIIGDIKSELALAATRSPMVLEANGVINPTRADRHVAAWHLVWSRMLERAKASALSAEEVADLENRIKKRMQTLSWNRPERSWIGKISATPLKAIEEAGAHVFIPTSPITSFANALSMSAAQKFFYGPLGFLARSGFFSGSPSAETPLDREVIMAKATFGTAIGGMLAIAAATGLIKVILRWPDDKKEREEMAALNLKPGMVLFPLPGGGFFSVSMTAGPLAMVSPELAAGAAIYNVNQRKVKAQQKLNEEAAKTGTTPAQVEGWGAKDVLHVAGVVALDMLAGTRTASGKAGSFTDYGQIVSDKALAGWVSSKIPFLPLFQNTMQLRGIDIDPRMAGAFWDMLVPLDSSGSRRMNMLGDTVADTRNATDILSMFTRGTGKVLSGGELKGSDAYSTLFGSGYSPPAIPQRKGYDINGEFRPMTAKELQRYTVERGKAFKQELESLGSLDGLGSDDARKAAQGAFQRANQRALASVGVSEMKPKRAYTRRLRSVGGITRRGRSFGLGRIRRGRTPSLGKLRTARAPRLKRAVLTGTRKQRVQRIVPANF